MPIQLRCYDFLYPHAKDVSQACELSVESRRATELEIRIPPPIWRTVHGRVTGLLPEGRAHLSVMFSRDVGAADQIGGGSGTPVHPDGSFEQLVLPGRYVTEVWEFAPPNTDGTTHGLRRFSEGTITVEEEDVADFEIMLRPENETRS